jgi:small subunit ribosomal protein S1
LKQSSEDPFTGFVSVHGKGSTVNGIVTEVSAKGAVVELAPNVDGYLRASEISRDRIEDARTVLKEGDKVEAKITSIERKDRKLSLSIKVREMELEDAVTQEYSRGSNVSGATLGDKLKEQLEKQSS